MDNGSVSTAIVCLENETNQTETTAQPTWAEKRRLWLSQREERQARVDAALLQELRERLREAVSAAGLEVQRRPSKGRKRSSFYGGYRLVDPFSGRILGGRRYDMSAADVIEFCLTHA